MLHVGKRVEQIGQRRRAVEDAKPIEEPEPQALAVWAFEEECVIRFSPISCEAGPPPWFPAPVRALASPLPGARLGESGRAARAAQEKCRKVGDWC